MNCNPPLQGIEKLRFSASSGLRPPVAPELACSVAQPATCFQHDEANSCHPLQRESRS